MEEFSQDTVIEFCLFSELSELSISECSMNCKSCWSVTDKAKLKVGCLTSNAETTISSTIKKFWRKLRLWQRSIITFPIFTIPSGQYRLKFQTISCACRSAKSSKKQININFINTPFLDKFSTRKVLLKRKMIKNHKKESLKDNKTTIKRKKIINPKRK